MKITIVGMGYVGLSTGILLAQHHEVTILDIDIEKVALLNHRQSPVSDHEIELYLTKKNLNLKATCDPQVAYAKADFVIICMPTSNDSDKKSSESLRVETAIESIHTLNPESIMVIKSPVPIGFTQDVRKKYKTDKIFYSPEFLREGKALLDNLYPVRIIIGDESQYGQHYAGLLIEGAIKRDIPLLFTGSTEAETIKVFSTAYLAHRVAFFNEVDFFSHTQGLNTKQILEGIGLDPKIGTYYNNPSFEDGGPTQPK